MIRIRNQYRYIISAVPFGTREVMPMGEGDIAETYAPFEDDFIADYARNITGKLKLIGADFNWLYNIETSVYRCDAVSITIQRKCGGGWIDWFPGVINLTKAEFNPGMCEVDFQIDRADAYSCFLQKRDADIELFSMVSDRQVLQFVYPDSELEFVEYTNNTISFPFQYWGGTGTPAAGGWALWKHTFTTTSGPVYTNHTYWVREKRTVDCAITLGTPWKLISESCPGTGRVYARPAILYGLQASQTIDSSNVLTDWNRTFKVLGREQDGIVTIDNGIKLSTVLINYFADTCGMTFVSDFFQINPLVASSTNYVTGSMSKVYNLILFQKSDVKRANAVNNAAQFLVNFEQLFFALCRMFNLKYRIVGSTIQLEHVSYWTRGVGVDLRADRYRKLNRFKSRYTYDTTQLPREERFLYYEKTLGTDFHGLPIKYLNSCTSREGDGVKEYTVDGVMADLVLALSNPEPDSQAVTDAGVFIAAADLIATDNILITEDPIYGDIMPNNSLGWSQLLRDYHRHNRPFRNGVMNNQPTTFDSVLPTVKGEALTLPICCGDVINPLDKMTTQIGDGIIASTNFSLQTGLMDVELLYEADDESATNQPPIANPDGAIVQKNNAIDIDVLANDSDANGIATIGLVEIVTPLAAHGTAVVVGKKIRYTPATDYVGSDTLYYRIRDNALQYSNIALVVIQVLEPAPVAVPETYTVKRNQVNNIPAPGLLANDSPGAGASMVVVTGTITSNLGVTILPNSDGSFSYTAPNIVGTDFFTYMVQNDLGLTDTATVTLNIIDVPASTTYVLAWSPVDGPQSCFLYTQPPARRNYYSTAGTLAVGSVLYKDDLLTTLADAGWHSNGTTVYRVGTGGIINQITSC